MIDLKGDKVNNKLNLGTAGVEEIEQYFRENPFALSVSLSLGFYFKILKLYEKKLTEYLVKFEAKPQNQFNHYSDWFLLKEEIKKAYFLKDNRLSSKITKFYQSSIKKYFEKDEVLQDCIQKVVDDFRENFPQTKSLPETEEFKQEKINDEIVLDKEITIWINSRFNYYVDEVFDEIIENLVGQNCDLEKLDRKLFNFLEDFLEDSPILVESRLNSLHLPIPTGAILTSSINSQIRKDLWQQDSQGLAYFKHQAKGNSNNYIEHFITNSGDIQILPWKQAEQIIEKFGFDTVKLHLVFAAHTMNHERPWENRFTLKATDIIQYFGWDKRTDLPLSEKLKKIAQTAFVLDCLLVKSVWIEGRNKKGGINASTPVGRMWNVVVDPKGQLNLEGKVEKPEEVYITVQPGLIFQSFLNKAGSQMKEALYQFGYLAQNILQIDPYHDELALRLAIHLTMESRYHNSGFYRVETLLKAVLPHPAIDEARQDKRKAYDLKQRWDNALELLRKLAWQIQFEPSYPDWLQPGSQAPKPPGWRKIKIIQRILQATIIIKPPEPISELLKAKVKIKPKLQQPLEPDEPATRLTGDQIREARNTKVWSQRKLADLLGVSDVLIGYWEKGKRTPSPEMKAKLRELLNIQNY